MLQGGYLFGAHLAAAQLGILRLLQVGQELLLGLSALEGAILFGVHG